MKKDKKNLLIESIRGVFDKFPAIVIINLGKFNAIESDELRRKSWDVEADIKVVKNSLLKIVLLEHSHSTVVNKLSDTVAILYSNDILSLSKLFVDQVSAKVGFVSMLYAGVVYSQEKVEKFAHLPGLAALQTQLVYLLRDAGVVVQLTDALSDFKRQLFDLVKNCANS